MNTLRRTKIVITLGPSLDNPIMLERVILAGAVVFRANFSHGEIKMHETRINLVREIAARHGITVAILIDLQGPKIRIGRFKNKKIILQEGQAFILDTLLDENAGDEKTVSLGYENLPYDVRSGDTLLLDDGRIVLNVIKTERTKIYCQLSSVVNYPTIKALIVLGADFPLLHLQKKIAQTLKKLCV